LVHDLALAATRAQFLPDPCEAARARILAGHVWRALWHRPELWDGLESHLRDAAPEIGRTVVGEMRAAGKPLPLGRVLGGPAPRWRLRELLEMQKHARTA
jgi:hypothetical protein